MLDYPITDPARQAKLIEWLRLHRNRHLTVIWADDAARCVAIKMLSRKWDKAPDPFDMGPMSDAERAVHEDAAAHPTEPIGKWSLQRMEIRMKEGRDCTGGDVNEVIASGALHLAFECGAFRYYVHPDHAGFWADCVEKMGGRCPFDGPETEDGVDPDWNPMKAIDEMMATEKFRQEWSDMWAEFERSCDKILGKSPQQATSFWPDDEPRRLLDHHGNPI